MKRLPQLIVGLLPATKLKNRLFGLLGYQVALSASIGPILILGVTHLEIGEGSRVGAGNVFRGLTKLKIGGGARLGQWNWISAAGPLVTAGGAGELILRDHAAVTSRHYIDCSGGVYIGSFSTVAGVRSTFITHGIRWGSARQSYQQISIGDYCLLSSNVCVTPGTVLGDRSVVGMGATIAGQLGGEGLYVAPRATAVKRPLHGAYFDRTIGFISEVEDPRDVRERRGA